MFVGGDDAAGLEDDEGRAKSIAPNLELGGKGTFSGEEAVQVT